MYSETEGGFGAIKFYLPGGNPGVDFPSAAISCDEEIAEGKDEGSRILIGMGRYIFTFDDRGCERFGWAQEPKEQVSHVAEVVEDEPSPVIRVAEPGVSEPGCHYRAVEPSGGNRAQGLCLQD